MTAKLREDQSDEEVPIAKKVTQKYGSKSTPVSPKAISKSNSHANRLVGKQRTQEQIKEEEKLHKEQAACDVHDAAHVHGAPENKIRDCLEAFNVALVLRSGPYANR